MVVAVAAWSTPALAGPGVTATHARHGLRCGTDHATATPVAPPLWHAPGVQRVVYLNRFGATFQIMGSTTNSATNVVSTSVASPRTAVIPPLESGFDWPGIAECVTAAFAPYDIRVVEVEPPPDTVYIEAVVGGDGTELGFGADDLFGIAATNNVCALTEAGVAFNFSETHRGVPERDAELCATIAHEVGHLLALEHETLDTDLMSYVLFADTNSKSFVDADSTCGVRPGGDIACRCSAGTTNSAMRLRSFVGPRATETNLPSIELQSPSSNGQVTPLFDVEVLATDGEGMADVLVFLDGVVVGIDARPEGDVYRVTVNGAEVGGHMLAVVARDLAGNTARLEVPITVELLDDGEACDAANQCAGGVCATNAGQNFCTQICDPAAAVCDDGFECVAAGDTHLCAAEAGGCCSTGRRSPSDLGALGLLILIVGLKISQPRRRRDLTRAR